MQTAVTSTTTTKIEAGPATTADFDRDVRDPAQKLTMREAAWTLGVHLATAFRWSDRGVVVNLGRGDRTVVRLWTTQYGGRILTCRRAVEKFLADVSTARVRRHGPPSATHKSSGRKKRPTNAQA